MSAAADLVHPSLPYDMKPRADRAAGDVQLQQFVNHAAHQKDRGRAEEMQATFGDRADPLRRLAGRIRQHALDHLDVYLERFIDRAEAAGMHVHLASDAAHANALCLQIARDHGCRLCVKSKSMVTEETRLLEALQNEGIETVETDLGEFILQLDGDAPSHIVTPLIHKDRKAVARAFRRCLGAPYTEDPQQLTLIAREHLRGVYRQADLGVSGANFLVAETGTIVLCTNEGNGDFVVSGPRVHVAMTGIEKVVPTSAHLSVLLKLLARSSTAQPLTVYTTLIDGPRRPGNHDGPEQVHVILVDNGRSAILDRSTRELLRCIRCGACLNTCPVFRKAGGGHAYGAVYSGPIGAVITPLLRGLENYPDLPQASSLCGACRQACPVDIDLPGHLVRLRRQLVERRLVGGRRVYGLWSACLRRPRLYRFAQKALRLTLRSVGGAPSGGDPWVARGWIRALPGPLRGWTRHRDFPTPPARSFRDWWAMRHEDHRP